VGALSDERTDLSFTYAAAVASAVFLGYESLGTRDHILLSQICPAMVAGPSYIALVQTTQTTRFQQFFCCWVMLPSALTPGKTPFLCCLFIRCYPDEYLLCRNLVMTLSSVIISQHYRLQMLKNLVQRRVVTFQMNCFTIFLRAHLLLIGI
jgi:hypothetical protein